MKRQRKTGEGALKKILVAGGAGYIGSHMVRALVRAGYRPVVFDNLSTGHRSFVPREAVFIRGDLREERQVSRALDAHRVHAVMHFAASSLVGESVKDPLKYWENNTAACVTLVKCMVRRRVLKMIFSSTAAVYGQPEKSPIAESHPKQPVNPYGRSKLAIEGMLSDAAAAHGLRYIALRYFNAAGADASAEIGEWHDPESHLIPNVLGSLRRNGAVTVFGDDYPTKDGTCVRDYIHVDDLCSAHLAALRTLDKGPVAESLNLGNGEGYSVMEVIRVVEEITGMRVRVKMGPRRPGDPATLVASAAKAARLLKWKPRKDLRAIVRDAWRWETQSIRKGRR